MALLDSFSVVFGFGKTPAQSSRSFKARVNHVFEYHGCKLANFSASSNIIVLKARHVEFETTPLLNLEGDNLSVFGLDTTTNDFEILPATMRTKYITVGTTSDVSVDALLMIFYKEVPASQVELIWEFIGKNR